MLSSGYTIAETSAACGFEDYFYFLKVFKKKTGMTPSRYQTCSLPQDFQDLISD